MFGRLGTQELLVVFALVILVFGPRKLPEIGRSLGKGLREFKDATNQINKSINMEEPEEKKGPEKKDAKEIKGVE